MDYKKLFHDEVAFQHETLETRMQNYGFKNMGRMELFLWDLELFLQMQDRLGDRVVLKGGAATQFYLPKEVQRTSVDIDMLFAGTESEIEAFKVIITICELAEKDYRLEKDENKRIENITLYCGLLKGLLEYSQAMRVINEMTVEPFLYNTAVEKGIVQTVQKAEYQ